ncbi:hypothetical protein EV426DRAFT_706691 [Tirmania nivea]|nr:hypothetical protein EV426DRAFT_706691 [Tirmania nivea]
MAKEVCGGDEAEDEEEDERGGEKIKEAKRMTFTHSFCTAQLRPRAILMAAAYQFYRQQYGRVVDTDRSTPTSSPSLVSCFARNGRRNPQGGAGGRHHLTVDEFLGSTATVMDAEPLGVVGVGVREIDTAVVDRSGSQRRDEGEGMKGHSGVAGNEKADRKAKDGQEDARPDIATPAGILSPGEIGQTGKGRTEDHNSGGYTEWEEWKPGVRAVVADGKGQRWEQLWKDPEWCEKVAEAVRR